MDDTTFRNKLVATVDEVAEVLCTSPETVLRLAEEGRLLSVRYTPDDTPVFRPEDVYAFVLEESGSERSPGDYSAKGDTSFTPPLPPVPPMPPFQGFHFATGEGRQRPRDGGGRRERKIVINGVEGMEGIREAIKAEVEQLREELRRLRDERTS